ncbi:Secreted repeat of unknown function [Methylocella silvestris BL2]|uniref:Lipoprotein n=1 Tax=Methylocella silvestris (strain DSM 15510 / CIP 108128 / LMG 27833 / NCIMB 13906 / BL2) TaxID=395965 RepID=B8ESD2_METSB|nr:hypothetical protein [Methylocella silvestris]ACK49822.1 Secreted repeat of unknown function [Methylocella silvestris BL2]
MLNSMLRALLCAGALTAIATSCAYAENSVKVGQTAKGATLVDARGMTLYTFAKDADGKSACNGPCAANWPPVTAASDDKPSGKYSVITRDDGSKQWAYGGKPLYSWVKDTKPGDTTGDGFLNGAWRVAQP